MEYYVPKFIGFLCMLMPAAMLLCVHMLYMMYTARCLLYICLHAGAIVTYFILNIQLE